MTLPVSPNSISLSQVNSELGLTATASINMNNAAVRTLFGAGGSGTQIAMSQGRGKSNRTAVSYTFSADASNASLDVSTISGYVSGKSDITITVNAGVYLYATSTGNAGLTLTGGTTGDTVKLVNKGYIMGQGGNGGGLSLDTNSIVAATSGGPALTLGFNTTIDNTDSNGYIGGGGGGGGIPSSGIFLGTAGGGAGGGHGGNSGNGSGGWTYGGAGGSIGSSGGNGPSITYPSGSAEVACGGGGGRIFPGTGGAGGQTTNDSATSGLGGGAGGGGAGLTFKNSDASWTAKGGNGGSGNSAGGDGSLAAVGGAACSSASGGGGGWGRIGGTAIQYYDGAYKSVSAAGSGGKAVNLNGYTVTWTSGNTDRVYGAVA